MMPTSSPTPALRILPVVLALAPLLVGCAGASLGAASSFPGVASDGESVYLAYGQAITAIDLQSGTQRWRYPVEPQRDMSFFAPPAVGEGNQLIVGDFNNRLHALDRRSGNLMWGPAPLSENGANLEHIVGGPVVVGERVLVPSTDGRLYARRTSDGSPLWAFPAQEQEPLRAALWASPVVIEDRVFLAALDHHLYSLDLATGRPLWEEGVNLSGALVDAPALAGDMLLIGTFSNKLVAVRTAGGDIAWSFPTGNWVWGNPRTWEGLAYFGDLGGTLYAVSVEDGSELWRVSTPGGIAATPAVLDGRVFVVTETGVLLAREASDSSSAWQVTLEGQLLSDPIVVGDTLLVASTGESAQLAAYNADSGAVRWTYAP